LFSPVSHAIFGKRFAPGGRMTGRAAFSRG
jgi:hypothetical protein